MFVRGVDMTTIPTLSWFPEDVPPGKFTLEEGAAHQSATCDCCGRRSISVVGFLSREEYACAVYFAQWTEGHIAENGISVGGWGGSDYPRIRIAIQCLVQDNSMGMMVLDPYDENGAPQKWNDDEPNLGPFVRREVALRHPDMPEIFRLGSHVINEDLRIYNAFQTM
jgi:hypothetical protein